MTDQTLPARMATSLAAALSSCSAAIKARNETANEAGKDQKLKKARRRTAMGGTGKSYGWVLKGGNELAAAAGVTGAAVARIDDPGIEANLAPRGTSCGSRGASGFCGVL